MARLTVELPEDQALAVSNTIMTPQEYEAFCAANPDLRIERESSGEVTIMAPASGPSSEANGEITTQLRLWTKHDRTGKCYDSSGGFDLPNGANRSPDAAWVRKDRYYAIPAHLRTGFLPLCPDFVIELRSQSDRLPKLHAKMREYIENGAQLGWLIDPTTKRVWVYRPGRAVEVLEDPATISGDPELPGFTLHLAPVWDPEY